MPESTQCSACGRRMKVAEKLLGRKVKCPGCGTVFVAGGEMLMVLPAETAVSAASPPPLVIAEERSEPAKKRGMGIGWLLFNIAGVLFLVLVVVCAIVGTIAGSRNGNRPSDNAGKIEGTRWSFLGGKVGDQQLPAGAWTMEFDADGRMRFIMLRTTYTGRYELAGGDHVTLHLDPDTARVMGKSEMHESITIDGNRMTMSDKWGRNEFTRVEEKREVAVRAPVQPGPRPQNPVVPEIAPEAPRPASEPEPREPAAPPMPKEPDRPAEPARPAEAPPEKPAKENRNAYRYRRGAAKEKAVADRGGDEKSEAAVAAGLEWLVLHQAADGHWSIKDFPRHGIQADGGRGCTCTGASTHDDVAATALGLLPFLGAGHTHKSATRYAKQVENGIKYLLLKQNRFGEMHPLMYSQALGTMVLCETYGMTRDERLRGPAQRALTYIVEGQTKEGGWRYQQRGAAGFDTSVGGWQMQALRSGKAAGLKVDDATLKRCALWLDAAGTPDGGAYGYNDRGQGIGTTAIGLYSREYLGWGPRHPGLLAGVRRLQAWRPQIGNIYYSYYATQVIYNLGGPAWDAWNPIMRDAIVAAQDSGEGRAHQKGSWSFLGSQGGRLFDTSLCILTLEVYYRYPALLTDREEIEPVAVGDPKPEPAGKPEKPEPAAKPEAGAKEPARLPAPAAADIDKAEKEIRDLFKAEYASKKVSDLLALSKKLLDQGRETRNEPASQYVLFREARDLAGRAGDLNQAWQAVDEIAKVFEVNAPALKLPAVQAVAARTTSAANHESLAAAILPVAEEALGLDDFETAEKLLKAAEAAAFKGKSVPLATSATALGKQLDAVRKEYANVGKAQAVLAKDAANAEASLTVGKYRCFFKGKWSEGLPLLAKGADDNLKKLATRDLSEPADGAGRAEIAEGWYAVAGMAEPWAKKQAQLRSLFWYQQAVADLSGLAKTKAEKRIQELEKATESTGGPSSGWIVIFRAKDPSIWNKSVKGKDRLAVPVNSLPDDIQYLRLTNVTSKEFVIIRITRDQLTKVSDDGTIGWNGDNQNRWGGYHLGIYDLRWRDENRGVVNVRERFKGWGFGHHAWLDDRQAWTWAGKEIAPTVFEIAVKPAGKLSGVEVKKLLSKPGVR